MGRARATATADVFATVLGTRRGVGGGDLLNAHTALKNGDLNPALRAVDEGSANRDSKLTDRLALHLAIEYAHAAEQTVVAGLTNANCLRALTAGSEEGTSLPVFDHELFVVDAYVAAHNTLMRAAGHRRGLAKLRSDCELRVTQEAHKEAASYLRRGGAAHLRQYFGNKLYSQLREEVSLRTDISPRSGALAPALLSAVTAEWVTFVCEHPEDKLAQANALAGRVVSDYLRKTYTPK
jgi:hypothetical protein